MALNQCESLQTFKNRYAPPDIYMYHLLPMEITREHMQNVHTTTEAYSGLCSLASVS